MKGTIGTAPVERFEARAMGSPLRLIVHGAPPGMAARTWRAVRSDVDRTEASLSRFRSTSDLSALNRQPPGSWQEVPPRLARMLAAAWRAQRLTGGRFDPRVIDRLEALGERGGVDLPLTGPERRSDARDEPWLRRDGRERRMRLRHPVDSGGIGKGLALRWALRAARHAAPGDHGLLIEAGGDLVTQGGGPDRGAWSVAVEDPRGGELPLAVVRVAGVAMATSSIAVRSWTAPDGQRVHHLIDPRIGEPADGGLLAVTVVHADPAWAEVWSKALFIAGAGEIGPEGRRRGLAALWVETDGSLHATPAGRSLISWTRTEGAVA